MLFKIVFVLYKNNFKVVLAKLPEHLPAHAARLGYSARFTAFSADYGKL